MPLWKEPLSGTSSRARVDVAVGSGVGVGSEPGTKTKPCTGSCHRSRVFSPGLGKSCTSTSRSSPLMNSCPIVVTVNVLVCMVCPFTTSAAVYVPSPSRFQFHCVMNPFSVSPQTASVSPRLIFRATGGRCRPPSMTIATRSASHTHPDTYPIPLWNEPLAGTSSQARVDVAVGSGSGVGTGSGMGFDGVGFDGVRVVARDAVGRPCQS